MLLAGLTVPTLATPKRLDLKKLLAHPQVQHEPYVPARAGWDGPEQNPKTQAYFQQLGAPNSPQLMRATLLSLLVPDWRILAAIAALILVLRVVHRTTPEPHQASDQKPPDVSSAA